MTVVLEPFTAADAETLVAWISSPRILAQWAASGYSFPLTVAQVEVHRRESAARGGLVFKALDDKRTVVGHAEIGTVDTLNRSVRIGRVAVDPARRGRGVGADVMRAVLSVAFDRLQMHRVELSVFDFNLSALACYERVGFRREGLRRDILKFGDEYWSEIVMSMLVSEWGALRG